MEYSFFPSEFRISNDNDVNKTIVTMANIHNLLVRANPPVEYLLANHDQIDWKYVSVNCSKETASVCMKYLDWPIIIARFKDDTSWISIIEKAKALLPENIPDLIFADKEKFYTEEFLIKLYFLVNWRWVLKKMKLTTHVLLHIFPRISNNFSLVKLLCNSQSISLAFLRRYKDIVPWQILIKRRLPQYVIEEFIQYIGIDLIFVNQLVDVNFINTYKNSVFEGSKIIPIHQKLPEDHIIENRKFYNMENVLIYQQVNLSLVGRLAETGLKKEWIPLIKKQLSVVEIPEWNLIAISEVSAEEVRKVLFLDNRSYRIRTIEHHIPRVSPV